MNIDLLNAIAKAVDDGNGVKRDEPFIKKPSPQEQKVEQEEVPKKQRTEMVVITWERYEELFRCEDLLHALQACGVDNWSGYSDAIAMLEEDAE